MECKMTERNKPPFPADHVGSLIRPATLIKAREQAEKQEISHSELQRIQQAAIRDVVRLQEELASRSSPTASSTASPGTRLHAQVRQCAHDAVEAYVRFHSADGDRLHSPPTMQVTGSWRGQPGAEFSSMTSSSSQRSRTRPEDHAAVADGDAFSRRARGDRRRGLS